MEWSNELVIEFLDLYESYPIIWDPKHVEHKNRHKVADAWMEMHSSFSRSAQISVADLKKKKDSLMSIFRQLLHKVKSSSKSGAGADDIYKPNWFAFDRMQKFLLPIYHIGKTVNSEIEEEEEINKDTDINTNQDVDQSSEPPTPKFTKAKKMKKMDVNQIESHLSEAANVLAKISKKPEKDQCSLYGELLAAKLRQLDDYTREILMNKIDNLVFRASMEVRHRYVPSSPHTVYPSTSFNHSHGYPCTNFNQQLQSDTESHVQHVMPSQPSPADSFGSSHSTYTQLSPSTSQLASSILNSDSSSSSTFIQPSTTNFQILNCRLEENFQK